MDQPDFRGDADGGSVLALLSADRYTFEADRPLAEAEDGIPMEAKTEIHAGEFASVMAGAGYGYQFRFKQTFIAGHLAIGGGPQWQKLEAKESKIERAVFARKTSLNLQIAQRFDEFAVAGIKAKYDEIISNLGSAEMSSSVKSVLLFATIEI